MLTIAERLAGIRKCVEAACERVSRDSREVTLLAVSKTFPAAAVEEARAAGQRDFGESRQQEAAEKVAALPADIRWHFIGKLQRNKVRKVLADFPVVHSIDSLKLARHAERIAGELGVRPSAYLEVNLAREDNKGGFEVAELLPALEEIAGFSHLKIAGLMVIPPAVNDPEEARNWFRQARELRDEVLPGGGLSMGMSGDFEVAIEEGSTVVRVGSAIFGNRDYPV